MHECRYMNAAFKGAELVAIERCCTRAGPVRTIHYIRVAGTEVVETVIVFSADMIADGWCQVTPAGFRAVVRHEHDEGIVEFADSLEIVDELADMDIEIADHRRID